MKSQFSISFLVFFCLLSGYGQWSVALAQVDPEVTVQYRGNAVVGYHYYIHFVGPLFDDHVVSDEHPRLDPSMRMEWNHEQGTIFLRSGQLDLGWEGILIPEQAGTFAFNPVLYVDDLEIWRGDRIEILALAPFDESTCWSAQIDWTLAGETDLVHHGVLASYQCPDEDVWIHQESPLRDPRAIFFEPVSLSAEGSHGPGNLATDTYSWSVEQPVGSNVQFDASAPTIEFVPEIEGNYQACVEVTTSSNPPQEPLSDCLNFSIVVPQVDPEVTVQYRGNAVVGYNYYIHFVGPLFADYVVSATHPRFEPSMRMDWNPEQTTTFRHEGPWDLGWEGILVPDQSGIYAFSPVLYVNEVAV